MNGDNAAAYARAGADLLVTSAPCAAPSMDVAVAMAPDGTYTSSQPGARTP